MSQDDETKKIPVTVLTGSVPAAEGGLELLLGGRRLTALELVSLQLPGSWQDDLDPEHPQGA